METVDTGKYLDGLMALLKEGRGPVPVLVSGNSMRPFLRPGDMVNLDSLTRPPRRGDVVLFTRRNGQYVLHRIWRVLPDGGCLLLGDNQTRPEPVPAGRIRAVAVSARRRGRLEKPGRPVWWFYAHIWLLLTPWREKIGALRRKNPGPGK